MKYDILVQTFTTGSKTIFAKKNPTFLAQKFLNFFVSKSVLGYYKTKKNKKNRPLKAIGVGRVKH